MGLEQARVGVGLTGSFCTYEAVFHALKQVHKNGTALTFVLSNSAQEFSSRFGTSDEWEQRFQSLSNLPVIKTIPEAEPLGPKNLLDLFVIAPCTGNTMAKIANGITDTPVLMAAKGHLRNGKPLLLFIATNDALGANLRNIGTLLNAKHIFFVPFRQDAPAQKPNSLVAVTDLLAPAMEAALRGEQMQPVIAVENEQ